jgi:polygalacturonase
MIRKNKIFHFLLILFIMFPACADQAQEERTTAGAGGYTVELPGFPGKDFLITDFGAVNDGLTLNTEAINDAIDVCCSSGGGRVVIPEGVWLTGPIRLKSNVNLYAMAGALVLFSRDFDDYPYIQSYFEGRRDYRAMPLIYGDNLENIAITGEGIFDGSGDAWRPVKKSKTTSSQWQALVASGGVLDRSGNTWWPNTYAYEVSMDPDGFREKLGDLPDRDSYKAFYRPPLVQLISCDRILLEGPFFQNSPAWCIHPLMCTNLTVNRINVKNPWYAQNGDGIDVESCEHVSIRNSHFDVGDDAICIKSGKDAEGRKRGMPTRYLTVENCVVHRGHGGFVVGSEMSGGVSDIRVSNCAFIGTDVGLRFKSTRGRGGVVENIYIENIRMTGIATDAIIFNLFYANQAPRDMNGDPGEGLLAYVPEVNEGTPEFRDIHISGITCHGARSALNVMGLPEMPVSGLSLEHSVFTCDRGISCLFAGGLEIRDVRVLTENGPTLTFINVAGAEIEEVEGNSELLLQVDGSASADISLACPDEASVQDRIVLGDSAPEGCVRTAGPQNIN